MTCPFCTLPPERIEFSNLHGLVIRYWDDWSNTHWNYSGLGALGLNPGAPHDVVINPTGSATVMGSADAQIRVGKPSANSPGRMPIIRC
jgi:hypothetical protein